jgi:putative ABC transport system substrate-binding protein
MSICFRRREFISALGGATVWPFVARAQRRMPVVGFLDPSPADLSMGLVRAFRQGLGETGYIEGRSVAVEYRYADSDLDRLPGLAADLVRLDVNVIAAPGDAAGQAAKAATPTIPVIFVAGVDPIEVGLVASLNRPGGNATGVSMLNAELAPKRAELLHELVPGAAVVALLVNPTSPNTEIVSRRVQVAARTLGLQLHILQASRERDFDAVFADLVRLRAGGLLMATDGLFNSRSYRLAALTVRHAIPAIYQYRAFAAAGGLMSYGGSLIEAVRQVGVYTGRVLRGEKPADLPVQRITKVELTINLKTAKALGLTVPITILGRADEVIE